MTARSRRARDVRALARELSGRTGVPVHADYHGPGSDSWSGWHLRWNAGPSREQIRTITAELLGAGRSGIEMETLRFDRSFGDDQAATALLAAMAEHPDHRDQAAAALLRAHEDLPGYPEREPPAIRRRAATLIAAGWRAHTAGGAAGELARQTRTGGWPAVCAWLDDLGARQDAPVIPLERPRPTPPDRQ